MDNRIVFAAKRTAFMLVLFFAILLLMKAFGDKDYAAITTTKSLTRVGIFAVVMFVYNYFIVWGRVQNMRKD